MISIEKKNKIVKLKQNEHMSDTAIALKLGVSRGTVIRVLKDRLIQKEQTVQKKYTTPRVGRPMLFGDVGDLQDKIESYFKSCWDYKRDMFGGRIVDKEPNDDYDENDKTSRKWEKKGHVMVQAKPYTVSGLAVFLGTSRETLMNYQRRDEYFDTIKAAKDKIYAYVEESLFYGKPTGAIFSLKNNYGWKDKQETKPDDLANVEIINDADEVARIKRERKELLDVATNIN